MAPRCAALSEVKFAADSEQADESYENQVKSDDVVQQFRHHENEDAGDQRYQWCQTQVHLHNDLRLLEALTAPLLK
jgi:hypothetical protein